MVTPITYPAEAADFLAQVSKELERIADDIEVLAAVVGGRAVRIDPEDDES